MNACESCRCFKPHVFELKDNIQRVRGLNKPFTRKGLAFGNILHMVDATIGIVSLAYINTNIGGEWVRRDLDKFFQYNSDGFTEFKLKPLKFKISLRMKFNMPLSRPYDIVADMFKLLDAIIGALSFAYFHSSLYYEWNSIGLDKLYRYYTVTHTRGT